MWFSTFLYYKYTVHIPVQCLDFKKGVGKLKKFQGRSAKIIPETVPDRLNQTQSIYFIKENFADR